MTNKFVIQLFISRLGSLLNGIRVLVLMISQWMCSAWVFGAVSLIVLGFSIMPSTVCHSHMTRAAEPLSASPKFGLVRHVGHSFCHYISVYRLHCHSRRGILVCKLKNKKHITDKVNVGIFWCDIGFSIVKCVSPDGFFGIQILPNSITTPISPFPTSLDTFGNVFK